MTLHTFSVPANQRFFEDYAAGQTYEFGPISVSEQEIVDFARQFDPQHFHIDPAKAAIGPFGGIIASGWHTIPSLISAEMVRSRYGSLQAASRCR